MRTPVRLLAFITLIVSTAAARPAAAQTLDPAFRADIDRLVAMTGMGAIGARMASVVSAQALDSFRTAHPELPDRAFGVAKQVLDAEFERAFAPDEIPAMLAAIYAKHFTHEEVRALLQFYSSDIGRKVIAEMPALMQEGAAAGEQWMDDNRDRMGARLDARLRAEGIIR